MPTPRFDESEFKRIDQDIQVVEAKKIEKTQVRQEKLKAKSRQRRAQVLSKLIAPILLVLTFLIALLLKLAAQG